MLQFCWERRMRYEVLPNHFSDSLLCHPAPELWDEGLVFPCAVFPRNYHSSFPVKDVSRMLHHVQGWTVWSYCFYLGLGWAGLCKAAAELYHIPVLHTAQKFFKYSLTLSFFPPLFSFFSPITQDSSGNCACFCQIQSLSYTEQSKSDFRVLGLVQSPEIIERV